MSYPARATDADLATDAAGGDAAAYASLYHRHIEAAWRLAQAASTSGDAAARATADAFVATVRLAGQGRDDVAEQFRPHLLAAVYREARCGSDRAASIDNAGAGSDVATAFAKLPSRWRAAVWLQSVEGLPATVAGPVLGVSSAAAVQLNKRGLAGLEHRMLQAGGGQPVSDLASALTVGRPSIPAAVASRTEARWK